MNAPRMPRIWGGDRVEFACDFALTADDHLSIAFRRCDIVSFPAFAFALAVCALFGSLIASYGALRDGEPVKFALVNAGVVLGAVVAAAVLIAPLRRLIRSYWARALERKGRVGDPVSLVADAEGLNVLWHGQRNHCPWESFEAIEEEDGTFYFWITLTIAYVWPARMFGSVGERESFREHLERWRGRPPASPAVLARMGEGGRARLAHEERKRGKSGNLG